MKNGMMKMPSLHRNSLCFVFKKCAKSWCEEYVILHTPQKHLTLLATYYLYLCNFPQTEIKQSSKSQKLKIGFFWHMQQ